MAKQKKKTEAKSKTMAKKKPMLKGQAPKLTEIVFVLDKSGSMESLTDDVIGGFNSFIKKQKNVRGRCIVTLTLFDTKYEIIYSGRDIKDVKPLTSEVYQAGGMTALLDATGRTMDEVYSRVTAPDEKDTPDKVIMAIMTDGCENSSTEYTKKQVGDKIEERKKDGWEFAFLGAGIDAFSESHGMGILKKNVMSYQNNSMGYSNAYAALDGAVMSSRTFGASLDLSAASKPKKAKKVKN